MSVDAQVRPPSFEACVPFNPTATSFFPALPGTYATADLKPCGALALSTSVHVLPPSDVSATLRPPSVALV